MRYINLRLLTYLLTYCVSKKVSRLTFDNNFDKCAPIFKIIPPIGS